MACRFFAGLDAGQVSDPSSLAVLDRVRLPTPVHRRKWRFVVRYLEEFPLGTPYPEQAARIRVIMSDLKIAGCRLAVDYGGVGRPFFDMLKQQRIPRMYPVITTGGRQVTEKPETNQFNVPKIDLVGNLQVLIQADLIQVHERLPLAKKLADQLKRYRMQVTKAKNVTFSEGAGAHDDLAFACMLGCWLGERIGTGDVAGIRQPEAGDGDGVADQMGMSGDGPGNYLDDGVGGGGPQSLGRLVEG